MIKKEHIKQLREMNTEAEKLVRMFSLVLETGYALTANANKYN